MPPVKSLDRISAKWRRQAQASQTEYSDGVANPKADWKSQTLNATTSWEQGVQQAVQNKRFGAGVERAGTAKWQARAMELGPARWAEGINVAGDAYETGFAPFRAVIERTNLPPRGPKGSPQNLRRVEAITKALHEEKMRRGSR